MNCLTIIFSIILGTILVNPIVLAISVKPGCQTQCGNVTVPYPFGIGLDSGCSLSPWYAILCATNYDPPRAFSPVVSSMFGIQSSMLQVIDISIPKGQIRFRNNFITHECYNSAGARLSNISDSSVMVYYAYTTGSPYSLSPTANRMMVVGCNDHAGITGGPQTSSASVDVSCTTLCSAPEGVVGGACSGVGCCEATIPSGLSQFSMDITDQPDNHTRIASWNPCVYAFIGEQGAFKFRGASDLNDSSLMSRIVESVPVVFDWVIGNQTCNIARQNSSSFLCKQPNTVCVDGVQSFLGGYLCNCTQGFRGNPYLPPGCTDIDECAEKTDLCSVTCTNTLGGYKCSCPSGHIGDGRKDGTGCQRPFPKISVALGASFGFTFLMLGVFCTLYATRRRTHIKRRNRCFQQNGGFLLKQILNSSGNEQSAKMFTIKELKDATSDFSEDCILGRGGYGTVYKGILPENQVVAIKKSRIADESQIEQFINELVILTRLNHPNVVKILGCCLESEVPLLVYEFIANGTLYDYIQGRGSSSSWVYSWRNCMVMATESAKALAYLHSVPIIHRDIKSTNILLDDNYKAKISDFGISKLFPMDQTQLSTLVQGTLGYLDPEYFFSSRLTTKSDVYSFGVVLAELLTRESPVLTEEIKEERHLSMYIVKHIKAGVLKDIVDPQLAKEATRNQLDILGRLILSCLNMKAEDRPSMKEVANVLEQLCIQA